MPKSLISILSTLLMLSCYSKNNPYLNRDVDKEKIFTYLDEFIQICDTEGFSCSKDPYDIKVLFDIEGTTNHGICEVDDFLGIVVRKHIRLNKNYTKLSNNQKKILTWHEAAHCYLNADHSNSDEVKLMRSIILSDDEIDIKGGPNNILEEFFTDLKQNKIILWW